MANPNKAVAAYRSKVGRDPKAVAASAKRLEADPMYQDMQRFQRGEMSAEDFMAKWK